METTARARNRRCFWLASALRAQFCFRHNCFKRLSPGPKKVYKDAPRDSLQSALKVNGGVAGCQGGGVAGGGVQGLALLLFVASSCCAGRCATTGGAALCRNRRRRKEAGGTRRGTYLSTSLDEYVVLASKGDSGDADTEKP